MHRHNRVNDGPSAPNTISVKQFNARARNWKIMQLRGMYQTVKNMKLSRMYEMLTNIDDCLEEIGAERQTARSHRERKETQAAYRTHRNDGIRG